MPTISWTFVHDVVEPVVWMDVMKFEQAWRKTDGYVGPGGAGSKHGSRYKTVGEYILSSPELHYPHVNPEGDSPVFMDGRHRTAWLRDHGACTVAVTTSPTEAGRLQELFGSAISVTRYR